MSPLPKEHLPEQIPTGDAEADLWCAAKLEGSSDARQQLFSLYAGFARSIAKRLLRERSYGDIDFVDLQQLANVGLIEALDRFDPDRGVPFRSFAAPRISGNIIDGIAKMNELREQLSWKHRLRRERLRSLEIAEPEKLSIAQAMEALAELATGLALGIMLEGTGLFQDEDRDIAPNAYESLAWKDMVGALTSALSALPCREQTVLRHHYMDGLSFDQLGELLGVSKGRVSQVHRAALGRLRKALRGQGHFRLEH